MGEITVDQMNKIKDLTKDTVNHLMGICMFCEKPIMDTSVKNDIADFSMVIQRLYAHVDNKHVIKELRGFFVCRECSLSQFKLNIVKQLSELHIDLAKINEEFAVKLREYEIKEQAKKNLEEEMKKLEESKNEKI